MPEIKHIDSVSKNDDLLELLCSVNQLLLNWKYLFILSIFYKNAFMDTRKIIATTTDRKY